MTAGSNKKQGLFIYPGPGGVSVSPAYSPDSTDFKRMLAMAY
uniref:Uncharacterized protein n=1 Tax=Anguilla anguilla TaxID=7936 RepID=A0A0E9RWC5_ANGAN